jgi:ankyrin repeat protein
MAYSILNDDEARSEYVDAFPTTIRLLLQHGADSDLPSAQKQTPYELALNCEQWAAAAVLAAYNSTTHTVDLDGGVNRSLDKFGRTVLHHATMRHATYWAKQLVSKWGADVTIADGIGCSPVFVAAGNGDADMVKALLVSLPAAEASRAISLPDASGQTPLIAAAMGGSIETVRVLLEYGEQEPVGVSACECVVARRMRVGVWICEHACATSSQRYMRSASTSPLIFISPHTHMQ